ncbi:TPA: transposase [Bacillus thuringiensis]|nr:transposase [Bacillus thuringiensis]
MYDKLEALAKKVDTSFPKNKAVTIRNGEPFITKLKKKKISPLLKAIRKRIEEKMVPINVLDLLSDTKYWLNWTRFFGPITKSNYKRKKKGMKYSLRSKRLNGINVYMTNTPADIVPMKQVHDWYSLRSQIEIIFKTWKSFFHIHHCKRIKREQLECHLYGQLIAILLCSSTMFQMRQTEENLIDMRRKQSLIY